MRKIDLIIEILLQEQHYYFYGSEFKDTGMEFFEVLKFDCSKAVKAIIGDDFFGENYIYNVDPLIYGREGEEEFRIKMIGWDTKLAETISIEQKSIVIEELLIVKKNLQSQISILNDECGVHFWRIEKENLLGELLEELSLHNNQ